MKKQEVVEVVKTDENTINLIKTLENKPFYPKHTKHYFDFNGKNIEIITLKNIDALTEHNFIANAVDLLFRDGYYNPIWKEYFLRYLTIQYYTNIELPDEIDVAYSYLFYENNNGKNLFREVFDKIDKMQWNVIRLEIEEKCKLINKWDIHNSVEIKDILTMIRTFLDMLKNKVETGISDNIPNMILDLQNKLKNIKEEDILDTIVKYAKKQKESQDVNVSK